MQTTIINPDPGEIRLKGGKIELRVGRAKYDAENRDKLDPSERSRSALLHTPFIPTATKHAIYEKLTDDVNLQKIIIDLLEPIAERYTEAKKILESSSTSKQAYRKAAEILELKKPKKHRTKRVPPELLLEYMNLVANSESAGRNKQEVKWEAIDFLTKKYRISDRNTTYKNIDRQRKEYGNMFPKATILPGNWPKT